MRPRSLAILAHLLAVPAGAKNYTLPGFIVIKGSILRGAIVDGTIPKAVAFGGMTVLAQNQMLQGLYGPVTQDQRLPDL
jgi:hypothetical protein